MNSLLQISPKLNWMSSDQVRPYVYVRPTNRVAQPGKRYNLDWFPQEPLYKNPLEMDQVYFADAIINMESQAFAKSSMPMPRWVFYDCAIVPGFVAGFAHRTATLPEAVKKVIVLDESKEWTPLSLFIIIPTMTATEWVAHNLCSVNSLVAEEYRFYGLGFLTKAFGLWYANVDINIGMTQWDSPALKLHSHYGVFEVLTSYTPVHSYAQTLTYRLKTEPKTWSHFFTHKENEDFQKKYKPAGFTVEAGQEGSLKDFQRKIESGAGPFFLDAREIRQKPLGQSYQVYIKR